MPLEQRRGVEIMCLLFLYHALEHPDDGNASGEKLDLNYQPHRSTTSTSSTITSSGGGGSGKNERPIGKRYKLIVASNRDEVLDRPTAAMSFWEEGASNILAGRDLRAGGTWLGVTRCGKFASLTNVPSCWDRLFLLAETHVKSTTIASAAMVIAAAAVPVIGRQTSEVAAASRSSGLALAMGMLCAGLVTASVGIAAARRRATRRSRGELVTEFLKKGTEENAEQYCKRLYKERWRYNGFNLVLADSSGAWVVSNSDAAGVTRLPPGLYGIGNATLDVPYPKLLHGKSRVLDALLRVASDPRLSEDALVDLLMDALADERFLPPAVNSYGDWPSSLLPAWNRESQRVCIPPTRMRCLWSKLGYGTRSQTVVLVHKSGRMKVVERNLCGDGQQQADPIRSASRNTFEFCDI